MNCMVTASLTCPTAYPNTYAIETMIAQSSSAMCNAGAMGNLMAAGSHDPSSGTSSAACVFQFNKVCTTVAPTMFTIRFRICTINLSDGLPVELLDFDVEATPD